MHRKLRMFCFRLTYVYDYIFLTTFSRSLNVLNIVKAFFFDIRPYKLRN